MHFRPLSRRAVLLATMFAAACSTPTQRIETEAHRGGLERSVVQGASFRHVVFARGNEQEQTLTVFLEGDGLPWVAGRVPASDPTPRDPLALHLATRSSGPVAYLARPCYLEIVDSQCSARSWTFDRYSEATVDSMAVAIASQLRAMGKHSVRLIGYSGGGVLAVLIAERLSNVTTVITIGANLDTDAWAAHHGYLPLDGSLNPARSTRPHPWTELHLQGALDVTVPAETTRAYFERFANAKRLAFEDYDHVCCWVRDWTRIQARFDTELR